MTTLRGCCEIEDDDRCPPEECVVRTDLVDAEPPPAYCESCPLAECEWDPCKMFCPAYRSRRLPEHAEYRRQMAVYYKRHKTRADREMTKMQRGEANANQ